MRRSHKKSRYGCKECKQRHAKCDESRPSCVNCITTKRRCSYLDSGARTPQTQQSLPQPAPSPSSSSVSPSSSIRSLQASESPTPTNSFEEHYSLLHLQLLHHFEHELAEEMGIDHSGIAKMLKMTVTEAFGAPFLMDQLLALSAAHQSTLASNEDASIYRTEATRLQTRALAQYGTIVQQHGSEPTEDKTCLPVFLFSTILGQHVLFDTFSSYTSTHHHDLAAFLDKLVHCLSLHRGIAAVAGRSWPTLFAQLRARLGPDADHFTPKVGIPGSECAGLVTLLEGNKNELSQASLQACRDAVHALQGTFDVLRVPNALGKPQTQWLAAVQEWPVRAPSDYINLLARRQPEALVVLAYYSVLLHQARDWWVVGRVGEFLIRSIRNHLGTYWANWLEWPNAVLEKGEPTMAQG